MNKNNIYTPEAGKKMLVAVFLSGSGTNFEALINRQTELENQNMSRASIDVVFSNIPDCRGTAKARSFGINTLSISSKKFFESIGKPADDKHSRELYDLEVIKLLNQEIKPDLIVLAGYRRKLSRHFYREFRNIIINLYPGDITRDYLIEGVPASVQAIKNKDPEMKCTVYIDKENERFGPAIAQSEPVLTGAYNEENIAGLENEIREKAEWKTFPYVIFDMISNGRIAIDDNDNIYMDNELLPQSGYQL